MFRKLNRGFSDIRGIRLLRDQDSARWGGPLEAEEIIMINLYVDCLLELLVIGEWHRIDFRTLIFWTGSRRQFRDISYLTSLR